MVELGSIISKDMEEREEAVKGFSVPLVGGFIVVKFN